MASWIARNFGILFYGLFFGMLIAVKPEMMLRWTIRDHPDLARNKSAIALSRFIGAALLLGGLMILAVL